MSIYIFQKQQQTGRDSSNINPQAAEPGEGGRPFGSAIHSSIYIELPSAQTSVRYLHHLRHGFIAIVVQRTISVSEVVLEACQVDFMAYVKCQCNGN